MKNFKKLQVWQESVSLVTKLYIELKGLPQSERYGLYSQMTRAAVSIPSNIAEGMVKPTVKDKIKFLHIANGSCVEMRTQTYIGIKIGYIPNEIGLCWVKETKEISSMLVGLINSIQE